VLERTLTSGTVREVGTDLAAEIVSGLHDLCQPLSTLQCRLEIGLMDATGLEMREAIVDSLLVCAQLNQRVRAMQERVRRAGTASGV
jgi:hypothetical protein